MNSKRLMRKCAYLLQRYTLLIWIYKQLCVVYTDHDSQQRSFFLHSSIFHLFIIYICYQKHETHICTNCHQVVSMWSEKYFIFLLPFQCFCFFFFILSVNRARFDRKSTLFCFLHDHFTDFLVSNAKLIKYFIGFLAIAAAQSLLRVSWTFSFSFGGFSFLERNFLSDSIAMTHNSPTFTFTWCSHSPQRCDYLLLLFAICVWNFSTEK